MQVFACFKKKLRYRPTYISEQTSDANKTDEQRNIELTITTASNILLNDEKPILLSALATQKERGIIVQAIAIASFYR